MQLSPSQKFVILANSSWKWIHQREHEIAKALAAHGYQLFFIEEMPSVGRIARDFFSKRMHRADHVIQSLSAYPNLNVLTPPVCLTYFRSSLIPSIDSRQLHGWLRSIVREFDLEGCVLIYSFSYWRYLQVTPDVFKSTISLFDYNDDERIFSRNCRAYERMKNASIQLARDVDAVLYSSAAMENRMQVRLESKRALIPNAVRSQLIMHERSKFNNLKETTGKKIIGFAGFLSEKVLDIELLLQIEKHSEWNLVLGGEKDFSFLRKFSHAFFPGYIPTEEYSAFIDSCDVAIIPFIQNEMTDVIDPVKLYEYCARGKPVVAMRTPALSPYAGLIYLSDTHEEFLQNITRAIDEDSEVKRKKRIEFASQNRWDHRVDSIFSLIAKL